MKVSVLMPVYNADRTVEQAATSILDQPHRNLELIAIDDGSTDDSLAILERLRTRDRRVRVFSQANRGVTATLNAALPLATGELVARMDADDISLPDRIIAQVDVFQSRPEVMLCGFAHHVMEEEGLVLAPDHPAPDLSADDIRVISWFYAPFAHPAAMFRRVLFADFGVAYSPDYPHAEDFDLFRRIVALHPVHYIPRKLLVVRRTGASVVTRNFWTMRHSHFRIVAENLRTAGAVGDFDVFAELAVSEGVPDLLAVARALEDVHVFGATLDAARAAAFERGFANLFEHVTDTIRRRWGLVMMRDFVDMVDGWARLRRWDQYMTRWSRWIPGWVPGLIEHRDRRRDRQRALPLDRVLAA